VPDPHNLESVGTLPNLWSHAQFVLCCDGRRAAGSRITIITDKAGVAALDAHRATLRTLAAQLREAERSGDAPKFKTTQKKVLDEWTALAADYRRLAPTPEMRARFDLELDQALGTVGHHHM
jgi:hypothetical protein